jgi:hypothetical protein
MVINALGQDADISYVADALHIISPGCAILRMMSGKPPIGRECSGDPQQVSLVGSLDEGERSPDLFKSRQEPLVW